MVHRMKCRQNSRSLFYLRAFLGDVWTLVGLTDLFDQFVSFSPRVVLRTGGREVGGREGREGWKEEGGSDEDTPCTGEQDYLSIDGDPWCVLVRRVEGGRLVSIAQLQPTNVVAQDRIGNEKTLKFTGDKKVLLILFHRHQYNLAVSRSKYATQSGVKEPPI